jgi:rRNA maturation endonuclease Nob1
MVMWVRILKWTCPRCGKLFSLAWYSWHPTDYCKHCGVVVDTPLSEL